MKIKVDDTVIVVAGKNRSRGKESAGADALVKGKVLKTFPKENRVIVENINMLTKHEKPQGQGMPGGIIKVEGPIDVSNVMYFCNKCKKGVRVGYKVAEDGSKKRVCKSCGEILD